MKKKHYTQAMTHKTDYASPYVVTRDGFLFENVGHVSSRKIVVRVPGYRRCFVFDADSLTFCPTRGNDVFYSENGTWYSSVVLDFFYRPDPEPCCKSRELCYKIRVYDSRWLNPFRILIVSFDDLSF